MQDRTLTHRTRNNTAAIRGLTSAIDQHSYLIRLALISSVRGEAKLQEALADLMVDVKALESLIVSEEQ